MLQDMRLTEHERYTFLTAVVVFLVANEEWRLHMREEWKYSVPSAVRCIEKCTLLNVELCGILPNHREAEHSKETNIDYLERWILDINLGDLKSRFWWLC